MPTWQLDDAADVAATHKYTFYKPSPEILSRVAVGENVKLIFRGDSDEAGGVAVERMWVLVDERLADGSFRSRLDNDPYDIKDLKAGDPVRFESKHIIQTQHAEPDNIVEKYVQRAFVTHRILEEGSPIGFLYREASDEAMDSGWRFTAGDESDEYMNDAGNCSYVSLGTVLNRDDSVLHLLDEPEGSSFGRDPESGQFVPV